MHSEPATPDTFPNHPFYSIQFQLALEKAQGLIQGIHTELQTTESSLPPGTSLLEIAQKAKDSSRFDGGVFCKIGFVGDTGVGKSSLINALLNVEDIAKTDSAGQAVTAYVTEYRKSEARHQTPFVAEATFLTHAEMEMEVKELLRDYRFFFLSEAARQHLHEDQMTAEDKETKNRSVRAFIALQRFFKSSAIRDCINEQYLRTGIDDGRAEAGSQEIVSFLSDSLRSTQLRTHWHADAVSVEELLAKLEGLRENDDDSRVKIMRVFLQADVFQRGIVLTDLPGLMDVNLSRERAVAEYLKRCEQVFIVARMDRIIDSSQVHRLIRERPQRSSAGLGAGVAVEDFKLLKFGKDLLYAPLTQRRDVQEARTYWNNARKSFSAESEVATLQYLKFFIDKRNSHVVEGLHPAAGDTRPNTPLDVFCVSNQLHEKANGWGDIPYRSNAAKNLAINLSGILELRRFCHQRVADAQLHAAKHYIDTTCKIVLQKLTHWTNTTSASAANTGMTMANATELENKLLNIVETTVAQVKDFYRASVKNKMALRDRQCSMTAYNASQGWQVVHHDLYLIEDKMLTQIQQHMPPVAGSMKEDLEFRLDACARELIQQIRYIHLTALANDTSSYSCQSMEPTYTLCALYGGTGSSYRRTEEMQQRMLRGDIYSDVEIRIRHTLWQIYK
ncbi:hypothetical protein MMC25_002743 [Agyrium rufum]|nr:hypothetical protein [Agyrium rufum]